jgi:hypothetical protein
MWECDNECEPSDLNQRLRLKYNFMRLLYLIKQYHRSIFFFPSSSRATLFLFSNASVIHLLSAIHQQFRPTSFDHQRRPTSSSRELKRNTLFSLCVSANFCPPLDNLTSALKPSFRESPFRRFSTYIQFGLCLIQ